MKILLIILFNVFLGAQDFPFFDGQQAYNYLLDQSMMGPRFPSSEGHNKMKIYLKDKLVISSDTLLIDFHKIKHPYQKNEIEIVNYYARFNLAAKYRILLMAHWDTREFADKDLNKSNQSKPIIGANDGASGVAVLLTISEILKQNQLINIGVDLLFTDAEDMGKEGDSNNFSIGAKLFSKNIPEPKPNHAICIDMVGDMDLEFKKEYFSMVYAPDLVNEIWDLAYQLGFSEFVNEVGVPIIDDHYVFYNVNDWIR